MTVVSRGAALAMTLLLAACGPSPAEVESARTADVRAREWLALIDAGDFGESWETAARLFQARITKEEWEILSWRVRPSQGRPRERELVAAKYTATVPWEPPGEHVFIQYRIENPDGSFTLETLTMRLDAEKWKTLGYNVRPE